MTRSLRMRLKGSNVQVIEGDATEMPFADSHFSGAVSFTMLHHVPSRELQKQGPRGSVPRPEARRFLRGQRQSSELVNAHHSCRRHVCSHKSRYRRGALAECGF